MNGSGVIRIQHLPRRRERSGGATAETTDAAPQIRSAAASPVVQVDEIIHRIPGDGILDHL